MTQNFLVSEGLVMTTADYQHNRMYIEQEKLKKFFPQFFMYRGKSGRIEGAKGWLKTNVGNIYLMKINITSDYPYKIPEVYPDNWKPKKGTQHLYNDEMLCLMMSSQWKQSYTLAFMVAKTAIWLNKYEVWREKDSWPGKQQYH